MTHCVQLKTLEDCRISLIVNDKVFKSESKLHIALDLLAEAHDLSLLLGGAARVGHHSALCIHVLLSVQAVRISSEVHICFTSLKLFHLDCRVHFLAT